GVNPLSFMGTRRNRRWLLLLAALAAFAGGCNRQDTECLARIGRKTIGRTAGLTGDFRNTLTSGWQGVCTTLDETSVESRVLARLRWEQTLAESKLEVRLKDGSIELSGTVADLTCRRRAVALAESTAGVSKVVD